MASWPIVLVKLVKYESVSADRMVHFIILSSASNSQMDSRFKSYSTAFDQAIPFCLFTIFCRSKGHFVIEKTGKILVHAQDPRILGSSHPRIMLS